MHFPGVEFLGNAWIKFRERKKRFSPRVSSSETQGQIKGARESRRKEKNGKKSPWGQYLTRPVPNGRRRSGFWLVPEKRKFSFLLTVLYFSSFHIYFSARLDFLSSPLSAPGSPRMRVFTISIKSCRRKFHVAVQVQLGVDFGPSSCL